MIIEAALQEGFQFLTTLGVETAMLDATVLLCEALGLTKEKLFISKKEPMEDEEYQRYKGFLEKRQAGYPVSYIRRKKEFYGLEFYVDERVLVPRPETELLVETLLNLIKEIDGRPRVHDLCTGSGCIPITIKKQLEDLEISASDISWDVREVYQINCERILGYKIPFIISDLFDSLEGRFDIISANPPYIKEEEYLRMKENHWPEPELALLGGRDGLELTKKLSKEALPFLMPGGYLVMESGFDCMKELTTHMEGLGYKEVRVIKDLAGLDRIILGKK